MATKKSEDTKKGSGTSKFFLGAVLGALAGAVASKFIKMNASDDNKDGCESKDDCKCESECKCKAKNKRNHCECGKENNDQAEAK